MLAALSCSDNATSPEDPPDTGPGPGTATIEPSGGAVSARIATDLGFFGFSADSTVSTPGVPPEHLATQAGGGNHLSAAPVDCQQLIASTKAWFDTYVQTDQFEKAVAAALQIAALLQDNSCPGDQAWLAEARQIGCDGMTDAIQSARTTPTTDYGDFYEQIDEVLKRQDIQQRLLHLAARRPDRHRAAQRIQLPVLLPEEPQHPQRWKCKARRR
jgi:hypothetical protein